MCLLQNTHRCSTILLKTTARKRRGHSITGQKIVHTQARKCRHHSSWDQKLGHTIGRVFEQQPTHRVVANSLHHTSGGLQGGLLRRSKEYLGMSDLPSIHLSKTQHDAENAGPYKHNEIHSTQTPPSRGFVSKYNYPPPERCHIRNEPLFAMTLWISGQWNGAWQI